MTGKKPTYEELEKRAAELEQSVEDHKKTRDFLYSVLDAIPCPIAVKDVEHKWLFINKVICDILARSREEMMGVTDYDLLRKEEADIFRAVEEEVFRTGEANVNEEMVTEADGRQRWQITTKSLFHSEAGEKLLLAIANDITERKAAERAMQENEEKYRAIVDNTLFGIGVNDGDRIVFANNAFLEIYGYDTFEELAAKPLLEHLTPESREVVMDYRRRRDRGEPPLDFPETEFIRKDGEIRTQQLIPKVITLGGKQYTQSVFIDITERKRTEQELKKHREHLEELAMSRTEELRKATEQLLQSQKMEAIGQLAGGIAHDFNNIIATICGTAEMLVKTTPPGAPEIKKLERILNSSQRAKDLTMKLLTFARKEKLNVKTIHPDEIVADVCDMLKSTTSKKITVACRCDKAAKHINADANQIFQAILNMCLNACDAMPQGGVLTLGAGGASIGEYAAAERGVKSGEFAVVSVQDTGTGIDEDHIGSIFEPFFTTKDRGKGSGLGLSVSHGVIKAHGGFIDVKTEKGRGTTFSVYLPVADSVETPVDEDEKKINTKTINGSVLVVDDDQEFAQMIGESLEMEGFIVATALSGKEAIDYYRDKSGEIDVILLDMLLPEMAGTEIFRRLKELNPDAKIVLCSGFSSEGDASALMEKGALAFIQKPFHIAEAVDVLSGILQKDGGRTGA